MSNAIIVYIMLITFVAGFVTYVSILRTCFCRLVIPINIGPIIRVYMCALKQFITLET